MSNPKQKKQSRERGTLQQTLPKPALIISLFFLICTAISTCIAQLSFVDDNSDIVAEEEFRILNVKVSILIKASLGVASSIVGNLYTDPSAHLLALAAGLLISVDAASLSTEQSMYTMVPIVAFILGKLSPVKRILSALISMKHGTISNASSIALKNMYITSIPLILMIMFGCSRIIHYNLSDSTDIKCSYTVLLTLASIYIHHAYYVNRAHTHGSLTIEPAYMGMAVLTILSSVYTTLQLILNSPTDEKTMIFEKIMIFLIGALVASTASASFAGVADVWYAVGSGQFQMISLDTAGIGFYFVLPLSILSLRFVEKYGDWLDYVQEKFAALVVSGPTAVHFDGFFDANEDDAIWVYICLAVLMLMNVIMGITMVNSLCPLSGYLFGRTYTHGQPYTGKIAVCVGYACFKTITETERNGLFKILNAAKSKDGKNKDVKAVLNINVSSTDLAKHKEDIQKLRKEGHEIVITMDGSSVNSINAAYQSYATIFDGASPTWYHTGNNMSGSVPRCHSMASMLELRSAMWSNYITSVKDAELLKEGLEKHRGGSFVYVRASQSCDVLAILKRVLELLEDASFVPASLTLVAKEDNTMVL